MMQLTKVFRAVVLILIAAVVHKGCNNVDFELEASKDYTNVITQSVGPTTSLTSRSLVDTDDTHYLYLDATTGDDADSGFTPALAKKTFDAAFVAMAGARFVIHIMDSSIYESVIVSAISFNAAVESGIQAALGQTPTVTFDISNTRIYLDDGSGGGKILSGVTIIQRNASGTTAVEMAIDGSGDYTVKDCLIINKASVTALPGDKSALNASTTLASTANITIVNNIFISENVFRTVRVSPTAGTVGFSSNIVYNKSKPIIGNNVGDYDESQYYLGAAPSLVLDFDAPTLTATINGASGVASLSPGIWVGFALKLAAGSDQLYYIKSNSATSFVLEDRYGVGLASAAAITSGVFGFAPQAPLYVSGTPTGNIAISIKQNIFVCNNNQAGIIYTAHTNPTTNVGTVEGNVVLNANIGITLAKLTAQGTADVGTVNSAENIYYTSIETEYTYLDSRTATPDAGMTITTADLSNTLTPLYFNQQNALIAPTISPYVDPILGYVKAAYDFRLRQKGKKYFATDTQVMIVNSPFLGLYTTPAPDEDLSPWEETLVADPIVYASTITLDYDPGKVQGLFNPKNPVEIDDLHGNPKVDWDSRRKQITLDFTNRGDEAYISNETIWKLERLHEDKGVKKWYPFGIGESMMPNSADGVLTTVTPTTATFVPDPLPVFFQPHHWKGFWITIAASPDPLDYYISDNTATTFSLIDKLGNGFPANGTYLFSIQYMLIQTKPDSLVFAQSNFFEFLWEEKAGTKRFEWNGSKIVLKEAENPV